MEKILEILFELLWILCSIPGLFVLFMFAFSFATGIFTVKTPLKPLLIVNLSVSITAALILFTANIMFEYWLMGSAVNLVLIGLMFLLILLPNVILFIKFRKQQEKYQFKKHISNSIILFLCHIPSMVLIFWYMANLFVQF